MINRYKILKIWTDCLTEQQALDKVEKFMSRKRGLSTILSSNPEMNFIAPSDQKLYSIFKKADLLLPDGIGVVIAARIIYNINITRLPGCEFMEAICSLAQIRGYKVYILGSKKEVIHGAVMKLKEKMPRLNIVGYSHGYLPDNLMAQKVEEINESGAQILFLALGSPKQEQWIANYGEHLTSVRICQVVGGSLDVINGNVKRAPAFFCRHGIEWLYRLATEPKRITRQWVLPLFAAQIISAKIWFLFKRCAPDVISRP
jgi:N-acetylglucosaminyldiphosphoundecaprenol N-acetyl-beta-D-mannosaminyltransferase